MRAARTALLPLPTLAVAGMATGLVACLAGCAGPDQQTLSGLHGVKADMTEVQIDDGLEQAMYGYRRFLEEAPKSSLTPEAMRRLADLKLEKEFGALGHREPAVLPTPETRTAAKPIPDDSSAPSHPANIAHHAESEPDFERRISGETDDLPSNDIPAQPLAAGLEEATSGPRDAIELYDRILAQYPGYPHNDQVLYQKARAHDELGESDRAIAVVDRLIAQYPHSRYIDEVQFRRAEYFFTRKKYYEAELSYAAVTHFGAASHYYELALYKLGWTLYKQDMHEEALDCYVELLDYKVSTGYDFAQADDENDDSDGRRIAASYRLISLSFSNLGGAEAVEGYFVARGSRSYEDRIYSHLGEFYLEKLRYNDAAISYQAFVSLHPLHRSSPHFSMRVAEIYEAGSFPKLVLEAKKEFAASYGLDAEYWRHFDVANSPEVLEYLESNLVDLANHYHALYQDVERVDEKPENFAEALRWYRAYLTSFPAVEETPVINYQLADLLLENENFGEAAWEYERTAYEYSEIQNSENGNAAAAGYAAIYAHRENEKSAVDAASTAEARADAVTSTLRFVEAFPAHEHAAGVLGAAVDDLYAMKEYAHAIETGHRLLDQYPAAQTAIRRSVWTAVAHSLLDTGDFAQAEHGYSRVLGLTEEKDETRQGVIENLAASIYKQGEAARYAADDRAAADHFLRIGELAPTSEIRPAAEYDAGAALIRLEDWRRAAVVLEAFRESYPEHELHGEATKQIASVRRSEGKLSLAAEEYERVAAEAGKPDLRREALLLAGSLHEEAKSPGRALAVYQSYVDEFPEPLETAVETRFKIAEIHGSAGDEANQLSELKRIVALDASAGPVRTDRIRYLAARSALVLCEGRYRKFAVVELVLPFEPNLKKKQRHMQEALDSFGNLVAYEVAEVTAAATFYMAEVYFEFSQSLLESERPVELSGVDLLDYEGVLEEEAYPFEERSIEVHQKNLELMSAGVYNGWIEKSFYKLAEMMPGRYAKFEESSGLIASIDRYAYRAPVVVASSSAGEAEEGAPVEATPETQAPASLSDDSDDSDEAPDEAPEAMPGDTPEVG